MKIKFFRMSPMVQCAMMGSITCQRQLSVKKWDILVQNIGAQV